MEERDAFDDVAVYELFAMKEQIEAEDEDSEMFFWSSPGLLITYFLKDLQSKPSHVHFSSQKPPPLP